MAACSLTLSGHWSCETTCMYQQTRCVQVPSQGGPWRLKRFPLTLKSPHLPSAMQGRVTSWLRSLRAKRERLTGQIRSRAKTTLRSLLGLGSLSYPPCFWLLHISVATWQVWVALAHPCEGLCHDLLLGKSDVYLLLCANREKRRQTQSLNHALTALQLLVCCQQFCIP